MKQLRNRETVRLTFPYGNSRALVLYCIHPEVKFDAFTVYMPQMGSNKKLVRIVFQIFSNKNNMKINFDQTHEKIMSYPLKWVILL